MTCAFCGRTRPGSEEHAIPRWLLRYIDKVDGTGTVRLRRGGATIEMPAITTRRVCSPCNSGWMADLEEVASPLIKQMNEQRVWLEMIHQFMLARWSVKTMFAMHLAATPRSDDLWMTAADYRLLTTSDLALPRGLSVMLGAYEGPIGGTSGIEPVHAEIRRTSYASGEPVLRMAMQIRGLLLHVVLFPSDHTMHLTVDEDGAKHLHLLWPFRTRPRDVDRVHWPPSVCYTPSTVDRFWALEPLLGRAPDA